MWRKQAAHMRPLTNVEQTLCSLRDGETASFQETVRHLPRRNHIDLLEQAAPQPEDLEEQVETDQMSQDDEISVHDEAEEQSVPMIIPRNEELLTETPAPPQHPTDPPGQQLNSKSPTFRGFQSPSSAEPSSSSGMSADTSRPVFQRDKRSRKRFMSDDQPSSAAVNPVKPLAMKKENRQFLERFCRVGVSTVFVRCATAG